MELADRTRPLHFLVHDRDAKFSAVFDEVFRTEGVEIIRTPVKAPNANAHRRDRLGGLIHEYALAA